ncbi:MAG: alpha-L-fucosidase [Planctomycetota bacterium]
MNLATLLLSISLALAGAASAQSQVDPDALAHWRSLRFGMFIHWGPVSLTGHEIGWSRGRETPIDEYDVLPSRFNPVEFDPDAWAATAKAAGMKYVVLTTKHHDGFCLWPSDETEFDIMSTPFRRDVVGELAAACRKQGLEFGTYYSVPDWHHPDYPKGSPAGSTDKEDPHPDRYARYLQAQVTELVERYGPLFTLWFDMPREFGPEYGVPVVELLRRLQPDIVINNRAFTRAGGGPPVGDYDTPEQRIGGFERERPWETCMTLCNQWSFKPDDRMKSLTECVRTLLQTIGGDGNLLFNVGPMPDGRIEPRQVERLLEMGAWIKQHEEAIYDTRGGPYRPGDWGASTCKGNRVFLFLCEWPEEGMLRLPLPGAEPLKVTGPAGLRATWDEGELLISLDGQARDPIATQVELVFEQPAFLLAPLDVPRPPSGSLACGRSARASNVFHGQEEYAASRAFDDDSKTRWATDAGTKSAWIEVDLEQPTVVSRIAIQEAEEYQRVREFELRYEAEGAWTTIHRGTTLGPGWSLEFKPVTVRRFRLEILDASEGPTLCEIRLFAPAESH